MTVTTWKKINHCLVEEDRLADALRSAADVIQKNRYSWNILEVVVREVGDSDQVSFYEVGIYYRDYENSAAEGDEEDGMA